MHNLDYKVKIIASENANKIKIKLYFLQIGKYNFPDMQICAITNHNKQFLFVL